MTEKSRESGCDLEPSETSTDPEGHGARAAASDARPEAPPSPAEVDSDAAALPPTADAFSTGSAIETHLAPKPSSPMPVSDVNPATWQSASAGDDTVDIGPVARSTDGAALEGNVSEAARAAGGAHPSPLDTTDDDGDERPTRSYGLAAPNEETPAIATPFAPEEAPLSSTVDSDSVDASSLMDEPPLDDEGEARSPLADGSVPNDRVRLLTADDTATALRLLHSHSLDADTAAGSDATPREPLPEARAETLPDVDETLNARTAATASADESVQSEPAVAGSGAPQCSTQSDVTKREAGSSRRDSAVPRPSGASKATLPPIEAASPVPDKTRSFTWVGVAAAATLLTAWWFISPLHAPPAGSGTEPPTGASHLDLPRPPEPERQEPARASVETQRAAPDVPTPSTPPGVEADANDAGLPDAGTPWLRAAPSAVAPEPAPISSAPAPGTGDEAAGTPSETDKEVARAALREAALSAGRCRIQGDPSGWTRITITFESSGQVSFAKILKEPFKDTHTAECVEGRMRKITVPPFDGGPWTLAYPIEVF